MVFWDMKRLLGKRSQSKIKHGVWRVVLGFVCCTVLLLPSPAQAGVGDLRVGGRALLGYPLRMDAELQGSIGIADPLRLRLDLGARAPLLRKASFFTDAPVLGSFGLSLLGALDVWRWVPEVALGVGAVTDFEATRLQLRAELGARRYLGFTTSLSMGIVGGWIVGSGFSAAVFVGAAFGPDG